MLWTRYCLAILDHPIVMKSVCPLVRIPENAIMLIPSTLQRKGTVELSTAKNKLQGSFFDLLDPSDKIASGPPNHTNAAPTWSFQPWSQ